METQYHIGQGRIDIVLFVENSPLVAIENKISAPIGPGDDERGDQLATYGRWIRDSKSDFPPVVCLLTHVTPAPEGFDGGGSSSGGANPHTLTWGAVASALHELHKRREDVSADIRILARELFLFLEEKGMSSEYAGRDEFAAAILYLRAGSKMEHTFHSIYNHLKTLKGSFTAHESIYEMGLHFGTRDSLIWGWKYLNHPDLSGLFFGFGIALDPHLTFKEAAIPDRDSIFLCVGAENKKSIQSLRAAKGDPKKPWMYAELEDWSTVICFKPLHTLMAAPETFAPRMIEWIDEVAEDVSTFVSTLI
jgi:hypothetical protein